MTGISELVAVGFDGENDPLCAHAQVELKPIGKLFYEVKITVDGGTITVVVPRIAVKVTCESKLLANNG
jgi:hypothetical protein